MTYAAKTHIKPAETRTSIEAMLRKRGANRIVTIDDQDEGVVAFQLETRIFKIAMPMVSDISDQIRRSKWRALYLVIKAKLEAVEQGISTVDTEFMAFIQLPGGTTVGDWAIPQIAAAYDGKAMLRLEDSTKTRRPT